ncbi:hypothetical protein [Mangrovicoccus sp. HB161399]|uniref:hypothetical protein n=1 Tax=Mangrovicoccus sp. HB161399 TaxID=2720392 RepID=UPI0015528626|nr:hypothetical protein [Mangrovicoccus sp. HB161399]
MDEVVLHVGTHKTGTTSIQNSLAKYDDGETVYAQLGHQNHSIALYTIFSENRNRYHIWKGYGFGPKKIDKLRRNFIALLDENISRSDRKRIVVSGEDISVLEDEEKRDLIDFISSRVSKVRVVCYLRSPASFAASAYQQRIKGGKSDLPRLCSPLFKFRLESFRTNPNVHSVRVKEFSREALLGGDIVEDFVAELGLERSLIAKDTSNESLGADATKLLLNFNKTMPLSSGDLVLARARLALIGDLSKVCSPAAMDKRWIQSLVDFSEQNYVRDCFGLNFVDEPISSGASREELGEYMNDLSDVDTSGIDAILSQAGIAGRFPTATEKIARLFLWRVFESQDLHNRKGRATKD